MRVISRSGPRRGRALSLVLGALSIAAALALLAPSAGAVTAPRTCPGFRVLHDDRIGPAVFPAGSYTIALEGAGLTCKSGGELFARFLEDFDGVLPDSWKVAAKDSGKASFARGARPGFAVARTGKGGAEGGRNPDLGTLCPGTFTVGSSTVIRPLRFTKGKFLLYLPAGSGITCNRAAVLFTRFLGAGGTLPEPWRLAGQTATFYKPSHPVRSAFRIEPLAGAGRR